jgi:hypothetical protein
VEAADLLEKPGRPHEALAFYRELSRIECRIKDLSDEERLRERQEKFRSFPSSRPGSIVLSTPFYLRIHSVSQ